MPLLASTDPQFKALAPWGYVCLAGAVGFFAANSLFGGSSGHVRYVTAQLNLERLLTRFRVDWYAYSASLKADPLTDEQIEKAFAMFCQFVDDYYQIILSVAGNWGEALLAEIEKYRQGVEKRKIS